jgi:putative transposase
MLTFPFSELSAKNLLVSYRLLRPRSYHATMPGGLKRYQEALCLHFVTFGCHARAPRLASRHARDLFEKTFEDTRQWYGFYIAGYVVMPDHVHLLLTEPERTKLFIALQMLKQNVARRLRGPEGGPLWQPRYYDFNVWSYAKQTEKLRYIHRNPVGRGLVQSPEEWAWSSFRHYLSGAEGIVEIESQWTARKRERMGISLADVGSQNPRPVAQTATRTGPRKLIRLAKGWASPPVCKSQPTIFMGSAPFLRALVA